MSIASETARSIHTGDGTTVQFAYAFHIDNATDLAVYVDDALVMNYTVAGLGQAGGGTITFAAAPDDDASIVILRDQPLLQTLDPTVTTFGLSSIAAGLDKVVKIGQMLAEKVSRAVKLAPSTTLTDPEFPDPSAHPGWYVRANAGGTGFELVATVENVGSITLPLSVAEGGTEADNAVDAKANLGITDAPILDSIIALAAAGLIARTGADTVAVRTIEGTANQVVVADGDGAAGNPTLSTPQDIHSAATPTFAGLTVNGPLAMGSGNPAITPAAVSGTPSQYGIFRENVIGGRLHCDAAGNINASFNVSSITDTGAGVLTITWDRDFANANYTVVATADIAADASSRAVSVSNTVAKAAGSVRINCVSSAPASVDPAAYNVIAIGAQAA